MAPAPATPSAKVAGITAHNCVAVRAAALMWTRKGTVASPMATVH